MATYNDVLAGNLRAARSRAGIQQQDLAARMHSLGFTAWIRQTVGSAERGRRRLYAEELVGLAMALGTSVGRLMAPVDVTSVELGNGAIDPDQIQMAVTGQHLTAWRWEGNEPVGSWPHAR